MGFDAVAHRAGQLRGWVGIMVENESGAVLFERNADDLFPSASVIKLPLVMALYAEATTGRVDLEETTEVGARVEGSGVLRYLRDVGELTLRDLATLALVVSDNTAANRVIERIGTELVNSYLDRWDCPRSRLRRRMYDFAARERGLNNEMTPRESTRLLRRLAAGELIDRVTSDAVLSLLQSSQESPRLRRLLPAQAWVANKTGTDVDLRNDIGLIRATSLVAVAGFCAGLANGLDGDDLLALLGSCAYAAAGGVPLEPVELV